MLSIDSKLVRAIIKMQGGERQSSFVRYVAAANGVHVGMHSYGGCFRSSFNNGGKSIHIGRYCSFSGDVKYYGANHPLNKVSMSPYFYNSAWAGQSVEDVSRGELFIGNDVWVGSNVVITSGCSRIGNGAVIGAGAIVTRDVEPYSVMGGAPAKMIKKRLSEDEREAVEESKWWEYEPEILLKHYSLMDDPIAFSQAIISERQKELS